MARKKEIVTQYLQEKGSQKTFTFKIEAREQQTYNNTLTTEGASIQDIPRENLFISESNHFFNVEDLIKKRDNILINPWTNEHFTHNDLIKLRKYPPVAKYLESYIQNSDAARASTQLSQQTIQEIKYFTNDTSKTNGLKRFEKYFKNDMSLVEKNFLNEFLSTNHLDSLDNFFNSKQIPSQVMYESLSNLINKLDKLAEYKNIISQTQEITPEAGKSRFNF